MCIKCLTKGILGTRQVEDHVCPDTRLVPTIYILFRTLFQESISKFVIYMFLWEDVSITE
jgi:hypothetical protein